MFWESKHKESSPAPEQRPQLELSGPKLDAAFSSLIAACDGAGGVEKYVEALKFRADLFQDAFEKKENTDLTPDQFTTLCAFMPTVRRRIGPYVEDDQYGALRTAMAGLFADDAPAEIVETFCKAFPEDKRHRWVRDLAAEILHNCLPEKYPLMCRWVWDAKANTGVVREIWHGDIDHITLEIGDGYETCLMLREELSQYISDAGIFRDVMWYGDLLSAQIYSEYISAHGGSYLRADFSSADDPAIHLRRLLGLDGVRAKTNRVIPPIIEGAAHRIDPKTLLSGENH